MFSTKKFIYEFPLQSRLFAPRVCRHRWISHAVHLLSCSLAGRSLGSRTADTSQVRVEENLFVSFANSLEIFDSLEEFLTNFTKAERHQFTNCMAIYVWRSNIDDQCSKTFSWLFLENSHFIFDIKITQQIETNKITITTPSISIFSQLPLEVNHPRSGSSILDRFRLSTATGDAPCRCYRISTPLAVLRPRNSFAIAWTLCSAAREALQPTPNHRRSPKANSFLECALGRIFRNPYSTSANATEILETNILC